MGLESLFDKKTAEKLTKRGAVPSGVPKVDFIPTGIFSIDAAIGGGLPKGRVTEIAGYPGVGKTSTALIIAQKVIENGGRVAWFEAEEALDPTWMMTLGIPREEIYLDEETDSLENTHFHIYHPEYLEQGLEDIRIMATTGVYDLFVYDSIGGSPTLTAYEADIKDNQMMLTARVLARFCAVLPQDLKKGNSTLLALNQVYEKPAGATGNALRPYAGMVVAKGGNGMGFLTTVRIMLYEPKKIPGLVAGEILGKTIEGRIYKNKVMSGTLRSLSYNLMEDPYPYVDIPQDIADTGKELGVLEQRGRFWYYLGEQVAGSINEMKEYLRTHVEETIEIQNSIVEAIKNRREKSEYFRTEEVIVEDDGV